MRPTISDSPEAATAVVAVPAVMPRSDRIGTIWAMVPLIAAAANIIDADANQKR